MTGPSEHPFTRAILEELGSRFIPNKVLIRIDPNDPPTLLAGLNANVKALIGETVPALRICEAGSCGLPIMDLQEARKALTQE